MYWAFEKPISPTRWFAHAQETQALYLEYTNTQETQNNEQCEMFLKIFKRNN